jgi:hypothetical protein
VPLFAWHIRWTGSATPHQCDEFKAFHCSDLKFSTMRLRSVVANLTLSIIGIINVYRYSLFFLNKVKVFQ